MSQNTQILPQHLSNRCRDKQAQKLIKTGDTVSVVFDTGKELTVTIKSPRETDPAKGIVSYESPLGKALFDKQEGEMFEYAVGARKFTGRVIKIN